MSTPPKISSEMTRLSQEDLDRLALDPHNLVMPRPSESIVPEADRMRGEVMKQIASEIFAKFKDMYVKSLEANALLDEPLPTKKVKSNVRHDICQNVPEWADFWKSFPRVYCKLTSPSTTQDQYDILVKMFDVRISEDAGSYADKEMSDSVIQQLLMGNFAKSGTFEDHGITSTEKK